MKSSFSLKWLFIGTAVSALFVKGLLQPNALMAVLLNTAVLTSFAIGGSIWLAKGDRCPLFIRSYVVIGLLVFISPVFYVWWPLLPGWLGMLHFAAVRQFAGSNRPLDQVFAIVHSWLTVASGLVGACLIHLLLLGRDSKP